MTTSNRSKRFMRGIVSLSIGTVAERVLRFIRNIILTRILAPEDFGLLALVLACTMAFESFTDVGIRQSVIQNKNGVEQEYLNVAWWFQVLRSLGLYPIAYFLAQVICEFYREPELLPLLRVAFTAILLNGFISPRLYVLDKKFKFGTSVFLIQGSGVLGTILSFALALYLRNVWALVYGFVGEKALLCFLSHIICPFRPCFKIDKSSFRHLMKYARGVFGIPILMFVLGQADIFVLGKVISEEELGLYFIALNFARIPYFLFSRSVSPVILPDLSEKQDSNIELCSSVMKITKKASMLLLPLGVCGALFGRQILSLAFGLEYGVMAVPFGILLFYFIISVLCGPIAGVYYAIGQPHQDRYFMMLRTLVLICLIYPASVLAGATGASATLTFSIILGLMVQLLRARKVIDLNLSSYLSCLLAGFWPALGMLFLFLITSSIISDDRLVMFLCGVVCVAYFILLFAKYFKKPIRKALAVALSSKVS
jgi:lipopolysaccharide exporter